MIFDIGTKTIQFLFVEVSYSDKNIPQIWAFYSKNHRGRTLGYLKEIDSSGNFATFFTSVIEKMGLYLDSTKENIRYSKLLQDTRYGKLIKNTQEKFDNNKEKIYYTSTSSIALLDPQKLEDIGG